MFVFSCTDVLKAGVWQLLQDIGDPELKCLAVTLPTTVLCSRANSSSRKYLGAFKRWKAWPLEHGLSEHQFALYLQRLAEALESKAAAAEAVNAVGLVHSLAGLTSPAESRFVQSTLDGIRRMLARPVQKKEPVTKEMLDKIVADADKHCTLSNIRLATACLLAFAGFLRFDELVQLRPCDIELDENMAKLIVD